MPINDGNERELRFPLNENFSNVGETQPLPPTIPYLNEWSTEDPDEKVKVSLDISLNEYVIIASAIDSGRDISFSDQSIAVWDLWITILSSLNFCQDVADCITDPSSPAYEAVVNIASEQSQNAIRDYAQSLNTSDLTGNSNPTCDKDILFGQCLQLVEYMDTINKDVLEIIEVATNPVEGVASVVGSISGVDESNADAFLEWVAFIQQSIEDNYDAQITQSYLEARACEIFCVAVNNNCSIDPTTLFNIWRDRLNSQLQIDNLIGEAILYLISGVWTGEEIADFMFFSQLAFRSMWGYIVGETAYNDIDFRLKMFANDPNPDWALLCPTCVIEWEWDSDFTNSQNIWLPRILTSPPNSGNPQATWSNGVGYSSVDNEQPPNGYWRVTGIATSFNETIKIDEVEVEINWINGDLAPTTRAFEISVGIPGNVQRLQLNSNELIPGNQTLTLQVSNIDATFISVYVRSSANPAPPTYSGTAEIVSVNVKGTDTNPFE